MKLVLSTVPAQAAETLASTLVEEHAAACVNVIPGVVPVYRWEGKIERSRESLLVAKTSDACLARLMARLAELHPYDVPEIVAIDPAAVDSEYLAWVQRETPERTS